MLPVLQGRWTALASSVVLGLVWGVWHLPLMVATGEPPIPYLLLIVPQTVLMTWVVNSARGSMLLAMLFHAGLNTALTTLYAGSWSTLEILLTWLVTAVVVVRYGPRDLARRDRVQLPSASLAIPDSEGRFDGRPRSTSPARRENEEIGAQASPVPARCTAGGLLGPLSQGRR
jgi:hypothetical protein